MEIIVNLKELEERVISCRLCPRLVTFRENVPPRTSFAHEKFWRKPVPGFGDPYAALLILGLAPAPDGGNRTGRIFTGDPSGVFLMQALYETGFANQPFSHHKGDSLRLNNCYITASVKCVPPKHHPLPQEFANCSRYLEEEMFLLKNVKAVLTFGAMAFNAYLAFLKKQEAINRPFPKFAHGLSHQMPGWPTLYASYHPSPQNTYTGTLTQEMLQAVLRNIQNEIGEIVKQ